MNPECGYKSETIHAHAKISVISVIIYGYLALRVVDTDPNAV